MLDPHERLEYSLADFVGAPERVELSLIRLIAKSGGNREIL